MKPAKLITSTILLSAIPFLISPTLSLAQSSVGISAIPDREEIEVQADKVITKTLKVRNESSETKTFNVYVRDFTVTDNKGTPNFIDDISEISNNRWAASSWIQVSPMSFTLNAGELRTLTLSVMPPANALPGGHYAAVYYTPETGSLYSSATGASVQPSVGTLVYITVPGDITQNATVQSFSAPKFSEFGPIDFQATIKNSSDIHIQPVGSITVKNWLGGTTAKLDLNPTNIFPYTTRNFENTLEKKWLFGRYRADLNAIYGTAGGIVTATIFFWVIPWRLILLATAFIAIIVVIIMVTKKKPGSKNSAEDEITELEKELEALKKKYKD